MLRWILAFLVISLVAAFFGFTNVAGTASEIARAVFVVFFVLLVVSALVHAFRGKSLN